MPSSYDQVPYRSYPYAQSQPARLAVVARLMGLRTPDLQKCRVLELGCASGGNLLPLAVRYPDASFVGIDASGRQVEEGQAAIAALGLSNARLECRNILDIDASFGQFDYILCHGVFSWVPRPVQEQILAICRNNLAESGAAYVSYNALPGWHMRGVIRDIMCYRARRLESPADRLRESRALLDFLAKSVPGEENPYGILLKQELQGILDKEDSYLLHDYLEEVNEPLYFHQFMERAGAHGLQYLGEADFGVMAVENLPRNIETVLRSVAADRIELEQYMDLVRNRMFRQTILCQQEIPITGSIASDGLDDLHIASGARPEKPVENVRSSEQVVFRTTHAMTRTTEPLVKAAFLHLGEVWPRSVLFSELLASARSRLDGGIALVDRARLDGEARRLSAPLVRAYATGQIELSVEPCGYATEAGDRPKGFAYAMHQAGSGVVVTTHRHALTRLDDLQRHVLLQLNGEHDREAILNALVAQVQAGALVVRESGEPVMEADRIRAIMCKPVNSALQSLADMALLERETSSASFSFTL